MAIAIPVLATHSVVQAELSYPLSNCRWKDYAAPTSVNLDGGGMTRANLHRIGKTVFGIVCFALSGCQSPMRTEAATAGFHESKTWNRRYPKIQLLTVAELLTGKQIDMPPVRQVGATFKKAPKASGPATETADLPLPGHVE